MSDKILPFGQLDDVQPIGQLESMTIKAMIVGIITLLTTFGVKLFVDDDKINKIVEGISSAIMLGSMVVGWIGRVRASKVVVTGTTSSPSPSSTSSTTNGAPPSSFLSLILAMVMLMGSVIWMSVNLGCAGPNSSSSTVKVSPLTQLYTAKQAYAASLDGLTLLINTGQIKDAGTLKAIKTARMEIEDMIVQADLAIKEGNTSAYDFAYNRLNDLLNKYMQLQAIPPAGSLPKPTTKPSSLLEPSFRLHDVVANQEYALCRPKSSLSFSAESKSPQPSRRPTMTSTPAKSSLPTSEPSSTRSCQPQRPATTPQFSEL